MNLRKSKYAIDELSLIHRQTSVLIYKEHTKPAKGLTDEERCALLRSTHVKLFNGRNEVHKLDKVYDVFDFSDHETLQIRNQKVIDNLTSQLWAYYIQVKDTVALGSEEHALSILKNFRQFCKDLLKEEHNGPE